MVERIYILIRKTNEEDAEQRFAQQLLTSPAFARIRDVYQDTLHAHIKDKIRIIEGNITSPNLGMDPDICKELQENIDLVIHVAGLIDFFPATELAFNINVVGTLQVANFVRQCKHAALVHTSTCYVAGSRSDNLDEKIYENLAPNGQAFDAEEEFALLQNALTQITSNRQSVEFGKQRAAHWGWTNTYTYTKALAEILLAKRYRDIRYTIVRPAIVESAVAYPFPGWNEGISTCGPYCYATGGWYPYIIAKKKQVVDIIPVDLVCNGMLIASAALLQDQHLPVYHLGTSCNNPLYFHALSRYVRLWHRKTAASWHKRYIRCFKNIKAISPNHILSPGRLADFTQKLSMLANKLILTRPLMKPCRIATQKLKYIDKLQRIYKPFLYDNRSCFLSNAIKKHSVVEEEFGYTPEHLNWANYWLQVQMPGLKKWIFPLLDENQ